jgi:hypothetical protein
VTQAVQQKMIRKILVNTLIFTFVLFSHLGAVNAGIISTIDQEHSGPSPAGASNAFFSTMVQTFTPTLDGVDAVELKVHTFLRPSTVAINLRLGVVGPSLGTTNAITLPAFYGTELSSPGSYAYFEFPNRITLSPGTVYGLELITTDDVFWFGTSSPYASGLAFVNGNPSPNESSFIFREGLLTAVPEPNVLTLVCAALSFCYLLVRRQSNVGLAFQFRTNNCTKAIGLTL